MRYKSSHKIYRCLISEFALSWHEIWRGLSQKEQNISVQAVATSERDRRDGRGRKNVQRIRRLQESHEEELGKQS